jgi:rubredoxin
MHYRCSVCDYLYSAEKDKNKKEVNSALLFKNLPWDWKCPQCGAGKKAFIKILTSDKK